MIPLTAICVSCGNRYGDHADSKRPGYADCPDGINGGYHGQVLDVPSNFRARDLPGVSPDALTVTNDAGGKQSASPYRCDLLPPRATLAVAQVLAEGAAKYGGDNWHAIPIANHLNHALAHVFAFLAGDTSDAHLEHAACRLLFAVDNAKAGRA